MDMISDGDSENAGSVQEGHPPVFDWPGESATFPALLERVNFHDGELRFFTTDWRGSLIIWAYLYEAWNVNIPRDENRKGQYGEDWLGICVLDVLMVEMTGFKGEFEGKVYCMSTIDNAYSRVVPEDERLAWMNTHPGLLGERTLIDITTKPIHQTTIESAAAPGYIRFAHLPEIRVIWPTDRPGPKWKRQ